MQGREMSRQGERHAEVYVRSYTPFSNPQNQVIQAAQELTQGGIFDDVEIESVPQAVHRDGTQTPVEQRFEAFQRWANTHGFSISQPFRVRKTVNRITDETIEKLVLPIVSLAVYEGDDVAAVLPCEHDDGHISVIEYLDALADGTDPLGTLTLDRQPVRRLANP